MTKVISRRRFLRASAASVAGLTVPHVGNAASSTNSVVQEKKNDDGELLYNGIRLPPEWPPRTIPPESREPTRIPYLEQPPDVIPISVGRQLFVDDFLIAQTSLARIFHRARKHAGNPILRAETALEHATGLPAACPKSGGGWWDPADRLFKMWYEASWLGTMAYATSRDGLHWERPNLDIVPGTNRIVPGLKPDSTTVVLDHDARDPRERFKLFLRSPGGALQPGHVMVSADGVHWSEPIATGELGDRSTMFYNPFRRRWVFSIRSHGRLASKARGRARYYREHADFRAASQWTDSDLVFWTGADALDPPDPEIRVAPQLYNLDAVGYESLLLGLHQIHLGPDNSICAKGGFPKTTELVLGYSRDGFHWHRPDRAAFIPAARVKTAWDRGYVQSVGGVCLIVGDELWFYYIGFQGDETKLEGGLYSNGMYANGATGVATLRRDGFASMSAGAEGGMLTTRPVVFEGRHLFVNARCPDGELRVEVLERGGRVLPEFNASSCIPIQIDATRHRVSWRGDPDLGRLAGTPVRFRFRLRQGDLYSFWVSSAESGASRGFVAAGGPAFSGIADL